MNLGLLTNLLDIVVYIGIFAIVSLSLNLEYGFTGLGNFGKVAFFLAGAYTYAILMERTGLPFYLALIIAMLISAGIGLLVSLPALRLREDYLAIVTLAIGEILRLIVQAEDSLAHGVWGITVPPAIHWSGMSVIEMRMVNIGLIYFCLILCFIFAELLTRSPYGRVLRAIREDEVAAEALGKDRVKYKAQVFMLGSALTGLGGALYAQYMQFIDPYMFIPLVTFTVWIMVIVGGPANNWGVLLGASLVILFERGARVIKDYLLLPIDPINLQYILFGLLVIFLLAYRPQGLLKERHVETRAIEVVQRWKNRSSE
ncbi:MAG: branched-chain amino acid ABC transporter permease [Dehalococcoidia bacterium]